MEEMLPSIERDAGAFDQVRTCYVGTGSWSNVQLVDDGFPSTPNSTHPCVVCHGFHTSINSSIYLF